MEFNACAHADRKVCSKCVFSAAQSMPCEHNECLRNCCDCYMLLLTEACNTDKEMAAAADLAPVPARLEQASITVKELAAAWCPHPSVFAALEAGRPAPRRSARLAAKPRINYEEEELEEEKEAREAADIEKRVVREAREQALIAKVQERAAKAEQKRAEKKVAKEAMSKARAESHKAVAAVREAALKAAKEAVKNAWRQARAAEKEAVEAARKAFLKEKEKREYEAANVEVCWE